MPLTLKELSIETLKDFTNFVEDSLGNCDSVWYRGTGRSDYELVPGLYRHPDNKRIEKLIDLERRLLNRFKQRSVPYLTRLSEDWDYLFLMQHFGVPTRLLDWTENPYIALYFALTTAPHDYVGGIPNYPNDAAVWVLDPAAWNEKVLKHLTYTGGILSTTDKPLSGYVPTAGMDLLNTEPVAMYGTHNSPRIVAQRGVFTIFGKNTKPMEEIYMKLKFPQDCLRKLVVPSASIPTLLHSVLSVGYTDSVIFPDLDGLAKELKRFFKFRV